jgi:hypothetical protein
LLPIISEITQGNFILSMKTMRCLVWAVVIMAVFMGLPGVMADPPAAPQNAVVPVDNKIVDHDLPDAPAPIKTLIAGFDQTRDGYLAAQGALLAKFKNANDADRDQIREELRNNRKAFLTAIKDFRSQLKDDLAELKGKISHEEFLQIINAAHDASKDGEGGGGRHRLH